MRRPRSIFYLVFLFLILVPLPAHAEMEAMEKDDLESITGGQTPGRTGINIDVNIDEFDLDFLVPINEGTSLLAGFFLFEGGVVGNITADHIRIDAVIDGSQPAFTVYIDLSRLAIGVPRGELDVQAMDSIDYRTEPPTPTYIGLAQGRVSGLNVVMDGMIGVTVTPTILLQH